jgi:hypothetical protein
MEAAAEKAAAEKAVPSDKNAEKAAEAAAEQAAAEVLPQAPPPRPASGKAAGSSFRRQLSGGPAPAPTSDLRRQTSAPAATTVNHLGALDESLVPVPHGLECPICLELLSDPVSTTDGYCYCSACINRWFTEHDERNTERTRYDEDLIELRAPATNAPLPSRYLHPVFALRQAVEAYRLNMPRMVSRERQRRDLCARFEDVEKNQERMPGEEEKESLIAEVQHLRSRVACLEEKLGHSDAEKARVVSAGEQMHVARVERLEEALRRAHVELLQAHEEKKVAEYQKEAVQLRKPNDEQLLCLAKADLTAERLRAQGLEEMLCRANADLRQAREEKRVIELEKNNLQFSHSFAGAGSFIRPMTKSNGKSSDPPVFCF